MSKHKVAVILTINAESYQEALKVADAFVRDREIYMPMVYDFETKNGDVSGEVKTIHRPRYFQRRRTL